MFIDLATTKRLFKLLWERNVKGIAPHISLLKGAGLILRAKCHKHFAPTERCCHCSRAHCLLLFRIAHVPQARRLYIPSRLQLTRKIFRQTQPAI